MNKVGRDWLVWHLKNKYTNICWELKFCLDLMEINRDDSLSVMIENLEHVFLCEWDCTLDDWYKDYN